MHFEPYRSPQGEALIEEDDSTEDDSTEDDSREEEDEIVGWGEDGNPIYADGSHKHQEETQDAPKNTPIGEGLWEEKFQSHTDSKINGMSGKELFAL